MADRQTLGESRAKLLQEIQRQRGAIRAFGVQEADKRIEPNAGEGGDAIVADLP